MPTPTTFPQSSEGLARLLSRCQNRTSQLASHVELFRSLTVIAHKGLVKGDTLFGPVTRGQWEAYPISDCDYREKSVL